MFPAKHIVRAVAVSLLAGAAAVCVSAGALAQDRTGGDNQGQTPRAAVVAAVPDDTIVGAGSLAPILPSGPRLPTTASIGSGPLAPEPVVPRDMSLVIVIQAALAERQCYAGAINGQWDDGTRAALQSFVELTSLKADVTAPSDDLLQGIRSAAISSTGCTASASVAPVAAAGAVAGAAAAAASDARKGAADRQVKAPAAASGQKAREAKPAPTTRRVTAEKERPQKAAASRERAPQRSEPARQASSSPGPAVFVRPVGVGRF